LTSAAGAIGLAAGALEIATRYAHKRKAFGRFIRDFQGVSFRIADSAARLDAARALAFAAGRTDDAGLDARRLVSEAKKVGTEAAWATVNDAMQVLGGIGYTNVFPVERALRDLRLSLIWTGTNEVMNLLVQHEFAKEVLAAQGKVRDVESDATQHEAGDEKVYE
ncbi:MAG: acyl-CoA dehydrogenase family protein, partial [Myxococcales bacterium]